MRLLVVADSAAAKTSDSRRTVGDIYSLLKHTTEFTSLAVIYFLAPRQRADWHDRSLVSSGFRGAFRRAAYMP